MSRTTVGRFREPGSAVNGSYKYWVAFAGLTAMVVVGWFFALPLLVGELLVRQLLGSVVDAPWAPFGVDAEGKTQLSAIILVVVGGPLLALAVVIVRSVRRRLDVQEWRAATFYVASLVALLAPFLLAKAGVISFGAMLGGGWLW